MALFAGWRDAELEDFRQAATVLREALGGVRASNAANHHETFLIHQRRPKSIKPHSTHVAAVFKRRLLP
jgi:hypothetical protein